MKVSLRAARVNAGFTQDEIADKIGVSWASIRNWEAGKSKISADTLFRLCRIYGVSIENIFLPKRSTKSLSSKKGVVKWEQS